MFNDSAIDISIIRKLEVNAEGLVVRSQEYEPGDLIMEADSLRSLYYCDTEQGQRLGTEVRQTYFVYEHPESGRLIEDTRLSWDSSYSGDYGIVRAAAGVGGSVVGNPSIYTRVDAEVEITFEPDDGYKLDEVTGTCPGSLHYNVYTAEPLYGDCWAVASFRQLESNERVQQHFNNLLDAVMFGRGG